MLRFIILEEGVRQDTIKPHLVWEWFVSGMFGYTNNPQLVFCYEAANFEPKDLQICSWAQIKAKSVEFNVGN